MSITPIDIRNKDFRKGIRGYQSDEVDKFLDVLSKEFENIYSENFELKERLQFLEAELGHYKNLESTLQQTMVFAQQTAEEVKKAARHEADLLLRESEQEKAKLLSEAQKKWEEIQDEILELTRKRELIRTQLKSFLHAHLDLTEQLDRDTNAS